MEDHRTLTLKEALCIAAKKHEEGHLQEARVIDEVTKNLKSAKSKDILQDPLRWTS